MGGKLLGMTLGQMTTSEIVENCLRYARLARSRAQATHGPLAKAELEATADYLEEASRRLDRFLDLEKCGPSSASQGEH